MFGPDRPLDPNAPVPTYRIDRIILGCAQLREQDGGHDHYIRSRAGAFRYAFNVALRSAERAVPLEDEFKNAKKESELFFEQVRRFDRFINDPNIEINEKNIESIRHVALPTVQECYFDDEKLPGDDPQQDADNVEEEVTKLCEAVASFLANLEIPAYRMNAGNRDLFTSTFIKELAENTQLYPFTPVIQDNWRGFAKLLAAGWEDLGLSRAVRDSKSYSSVYGWLADRVRTQFGFRRPRKTAGNPKQTFEQNP